MNDIAKELGAELIRRARDGTLNGQGGLLVKQAVARLEANERESSLRKAVGLMYAATRMPAGFDVRRILRDTAAKHRPAFDEHMEGSGI